MARHDEYLGWSVATRHRSVLGFDGSGGKAKVDEELTVLAQR